MRIGCSAALLLALAVMTVTACGRSRYSPLDASADASGLDAPPADGPDVDAPGLDVLAADASTRVTFTVVRTGLGDGTILLDGADTGCSRTCELTVPAGAEVTITAEPDASSWFRGWAMGPCSGRGACELRVEAPFTLEADFTPRPNRVFVTSTQHDGALGGTSGAAAVCAARAAAAGLPGTWVGVLSTTTASWSTLLAGSRGWVRVDGEPVFDRPEDWHSYRQRHALLLDESGASVASSDFWAFHAGGAMCGDWTSSLATDTSRVIEVERGTSMGSGGGDASCGSGHRLICAEVGIVQPVDPVPARGRYAFATGGAWSVSGGLDAADALCGAEATAAGLPGTYRALLATTRGSALSRFDLAGPPWVRTDGSAFLAHARDWASAELLDVAPVLGADGAGDFYTSFALGALSPEVVGTATCADWTSPLAFYDVGCLTSWEVDLRCTLRGMVSCASTSRLICLQE